MGGRPKIRGRDSSLAAVFVQAIIPRQVDKRKQEALYKRFGINPEKCVYCGQRKTDDDHFRAIVKEGRPSGYFHTADNIVPSCGPCNQSKSGSEWKKWMKSKTAKRSPTCRNIPGTEMRIARLNRFARVGRNPAIPAEKFESVVGKKLWRAYWAKLEDIKKLMDAAQVDAEIISEKITSEFDLRSSRRT